MKFEKVRDAEHYRGMFSRGDPIVGASLAARALGAAHPGADLEIATRYFLRRHPQGVPAGEVLRLMDMTAAELPPDLAGEHMMVHVYAEHCPAAGRRCHDQKRIEGGSDDVIGFEGTQAELLEQADRLEAVARDAGAGHDAFLRRCAASIREAVE